MNKTSIVAMVVVFLSSGAAARADSGPAQASDELCGSPVACAKECDKGVAASCREEAGLFRHVSPYDFEHVVRPLLQKACDGGDWLGCGELAWRLETNKDVAGARSLYERACTGGDGSACSSLGSFKRYTDKDIAAADTLDKHTVELWTPQCDAGVVRACLRLANAYRAGRGIAKDDAKAGELVTRAVGFLKTACEGKSPMLCGVYADALNATENSSRPTADQVDALYTKACEAGSVRACTFLGDTERSPQANNMVQMLGRSCDLGVADACAELARRYKNGNRGFTADPSKAIDFAKKGCDIVLARTSFSEDACSMLSQFYSDGVGVPKDPKKAIELEANACERGVTGVCRSVAYSYLQGTSGAPKDPKRGLALWEKTCEYGDTYLCSDLAAQYGAGKTPGIKKDAAKAKALYTRMCSDGLLDACSKAGIAPPAAKPTSDAAIAAARAWLSALAHKDAAALGRVTGFPFAQRGIKTSTGPEAKKCKLQSSATDAKGLEPIAKCMFGDDLLVGDLTKGFQSVAFTVADAKATLFTKTELAKLATHAFVSATLSGAGVNYTLSFAVSAVAGTAVVTAVAEKADSYE